MRGQDRTDETCALPCPKRHVALSTKARDWGRATARIDHRPRLVAFRGAFAARLADMRLIRGAVLWWLLIVVALVATYWRDHHRRGAECRLFAHRDVGRTSFHRQGHRRTELPLAHVLRSGRRRRRLHLSENRWAPPSSGGRGIGPEHLASHPCLRVGDDSTCTAAATRTDLTRTSSRRRPRAGARRATTASRSHKRLQPADLRGTGILRRLRRRPMGLVGVFHEPREEGLLDHARLRASDAKHFVLQTGSL